MSLEKLSESELEALLALDLLFFSTLERSAIKRYRPDLTRPQHASADLG